MNYLASFVIAMALAALYNFAFLYNSKISTKNFWKNVALIVACIVFLSGCYSGEKMNIPLDGIFWFMILNIIFEYICNWMIKERVAGKSMDVYNIMKICCNSKTITIRNYKIIPHKFLINDDVSDKDNEHHSNPSLYEKNDHINTNFISLKDGLWLIVYSQDTDKSVSPFNNDDYENSDKRNCMILSTDELVGLLYMVSDELKRDDIIYS